MSTVELRHSGALGPAASGDARDAAVTRSSRTAITLIGALLALLLYASFAHGAASLGAGARIQVAVAAAAALVAGAAIWTGTLRFAAPRLAVAGVVLLAAFAAWTGVTLAWSVAADQTWIQLNRALTYLAVLVLAIIAGSSHARSVELIAKGFATVALAVTVYALGV